MSLPQDYIRLKDNIKNLYRRASIEEQAEMVLCGFIVRVRQVLVNRRVVYRLGYRPPWDSRFTPTSVDYLTEMLYANFRTATPNSV